MRLDTGHSGTQCRRNIFYHKNVLHTFAIEKRYMTMVLAKDLSQLKNLLYPKLRLHTVLLPCNKANASCVYCVDLPRVIYVPIIHTCSYRQKGVCKSSEMRPRYTVAWSYHTRIMALMNRALLLCYVTRGVYCVCNYLFRWRTTRQD